MRRPRPGSLGRCRRLDLARRTATLWGSFPCDRSGDVHHRGAEGTEISRNQIRLPCSSDHDDSAADVPDGLRASNSFRLRDASNLCVSVVRNLERSDDVIELGRLSGAPDRRDDPARRNQRPQLLRPLLLQPARLERRAVHGDGRSGSTRTSVCRTPSRSCGAGRATASCARRASSATAWTPASDRFASRSSSRCSKLRFVLEQNEHGIACDLLWEGAIPAFEEPRQYIRKHGRVLFDTVRFAQTGCWSGTLHVGDETFRGDAGPLVGHARPLLGRAAGGRAGAAGHSRSRKGR